MPCGCKKGSGMTLVGAGVRRRRKRGGMAISGAGMRLSGAGYKKRRKGRRKKRKGARGGGFGLNALMFGPLSATLGALAGKVYRPRRSGVLAAARYRGKLKGGGGRFLSGAVWHGYGKGSGMSVSGAGLYGKRLLGRGGSGRRQI